MKTELKKVLEANKKLNYAILSSRGSGYTTCITEAANNCGGTIIFNNPHILREYGGHQCSVISSNMIKYGVDYNKPVFLDNSVIKDLLSDNILALENALSYIEQLENKV